MLLMQFQNEKGYSKAFFFFFFLPGPGEGHGSCTLGGGSLSLVRQLRARSGGSQVISQELSVTAGGFCLSFLSPGNYSTPQTLVLPVSTHCSFHPRTHGGCLFQPLDYVRKDLGIFYSSGFVYKLRLFIAFIPGHGGREEEGPGL